MQIRGLPVRQVLVEEKISIKRELYLAITVDRQKRAYVVLTSAVGGIDIEATADQTPTAINKTPINPNTGLHSYHAIAIAKQLGYTGNQLSALANIILKLYQTAWTTMLNWLKSIPCGNRQRRVYGVRCTFNC